MALKLADRVRETTTTTGTGTVNLAGAVSGYQTFVAGVGTGNTVYYCIALDSAGEWEVGIGTVTDASPDTLSRTKVLASSNGGLLVNFSAGTKEVFLVDPASILEPLIGVCNGRLTTESDVPISPSDRTAQGTIYFTPYNGNRIALYNGSSWVIFAFSEVSLSLSLTSGKNYDVFLYDNAGTLTLELSAAWTNDTTRADALALQDGVYVKSGAPTRRWLGTIRASGSNVTEDSKQKRFVWNAYNRVRRTLERLETTNSWTYSTDSWRQANASTSNQAEVVSGLAGLCADLTVVVMVTSTVAANTEVSIGLDSTTTPFGAMSMVILDANKYQTASCRVVLPIPLGYHYMTWLERGLGSGTQTWFGLQSGFRSFGMSGVWEC